MTMLRTAFAVLAFGALLAAGPAHAQAPPGTDDSRYIFNRVQDGFLRLDTRTGQVALCSKRAVGWACIPVAEERAALEAEIARLQSANAGLKKELIVRGIELPGGIRPEPPVARRNEPEIRVPGGPDLDRVMSFIGRMWRRLVEMLANFQKDMRKQS